MTPERKAILIESRTKIAGILASLGPIKAAFQAMPPMPQPGMPPDPMAAAGGGMMPPDPMAGGMPPGGAPPPMDPAATGGAAPEGGDPNMAALMELIPQIVDGMEAMNQKLQQVDQQQQQIMAGLSEGNDPQPPQG